MSNSAISFLVIFLTSIFSVAKTQIFIRDNSATILVQGTDSDAERLFNSIRQEPKADGSVLKKSVTYYVVGEPAFQVSCNFSTLSKNGSCNLQMDSRVASIHKDSKSVLLGINDQFDAPRFARNFFDDGSRYQAIVFQSEDAKLKIWKTLDASGGVVSFTLTYK